MEKRLVDANELKSCIGSFAGMFTDEGFLVNLQAVLNAIDFAPTIDPVEHGKWCYVGGNRYSLYYRCSICNAMYEGQHWYCPHCGARMDGE